MDSEIDVILVTCDATERVFVDCSVAIMKFRHSYHSLQCPGCQIKVLDKIVSSYANGDSHAHVIIV